MASAGAVRIGIKSRPASVSECKPSDEQPANSCGRQIKTQTALKRNARGRFLFRTRRLSQKSTRRAAARRFLSLEPRRSANRRRLLNGFQCLGRSCFDVRQRLRFLSKLLAVGGVIAHFHNVAFGVPAGPFAAQHAGYIGAFKLLLAVRVPPGELALLLAVGVLAFAAASDRSGTTR